MSVTVRIKLREDKKNNNERWANLCAAAAFADFSFYQTGQTIVAGGLLGWGDRGLVHRRRFLPKPTFVKGRQLILHAISGAMWC
jgi:hypothetical protein